MTDEKSRDEKMAELEKKLAPSAANAINLDDYELSADLPRHYYEHAKYKRNEATGEIEAVYTYVSTIVTTQTLTQLSKNIEETENGPDRWILMQVTPYKKGSVLTVYRKAETFSLPLKKKEVVPDLTVENINDELTKRTAEWEKEHETTT